MTKEAIKTAESAACLLATARAKWQEGALSPALKNLETLLKYQPDHLGAQHFYIDLLSEKTTQFDTNNKNYEYTQRQLANAWEQLIIYENTLANRKNHIETLAKLANLEDSPTIWVEYRKACENFFARHDTVVDKHYTDVLRHYANAFSFGVLAAFQKKRQGKPFNPAILQKISKTELNIAAYDTAIESKVKQLLVFVRAQQLPFELVKISGDTPAVFKHASVNQYLEQLYFLGFKSCFIARDRRLEKASESAPHYLLVCKKDSTFATLSIDMPRSQTWLGKLWKKVRYQYGVNITLSTFFTGDVVLKSLNKSEQSRYDAPRGYLVKCRGFDLPTQLQLHENHVDELERRTDSKRLALSDSAYLQQEKICADKLLAYKKSHAFMTFNEYYRATNIESLLSYSLIMHALADNIEEVKAF